MKKITFVSTVLLAFMLVNYSVFALSPIGDKEYKKIFEQAETYFENENYTAALELYKQLDSIDNGSNANTKFKIGFCYLYAPTYKTKAIPYLEEAAKKISNSYEMGEIKEKSAPYSTYYYLAKAYHLNYEFDKAISMYEKYKAGIEVNEKTKAEIDEITHDIETCNNGKELILKPLKVVVTNLGENINTKYADYSPVVSLDEETLIFTTRRKDGTSERIEANGQYFEDIFIANAIDEKWQPAKPIGPKINSQGHEATINLSADGLKLLVYKDDGGNGNVYLSEFKGNEWQEIEYISAPINSASWETHACFSSDNRILYFTSNRTGGYGGRDIYKCKRLPNGEWGPAENLGPIINTPYDEDGVFIHPDGKQIYFASKGHKSMGGFDIFTSYIGDEENGYWTAPVNFGYPVNTPDDEVFFVTTADGLRGFYSSDKEGGYGEKDIYMITFPEFEPRDITVLVGKVINYTKEDISSSNIYLINTAKNDTIQTLNINGATGKFGTNLPVGTTIKAVYVVNGKELLNETLEVPKGKRYQVIKRELPYGTPPDSAAIADSLARYAASKQCDPAKSSYSMFFKYNKKQIDVKSVEFTNFIDAIALCLKNNPNLQIYIESSASQVPTSTYGTNERLATARAKEAKEKVAKALTGRGFKQTELKFADFKSLVQGPEYNKDAQQNAATYEQYQYIKVTVK
ncbi:MAG: PD40 domain-containing protein [Bacteroidia bacterium]|nr:PD40 domain-containing protein [Bacteroidia bacterium]